MLDLRPTALTKDSYFVHNCDVAMRGLDWRKLRWRGARSVLRPLRTLFGPLVPYLGRATPCYEERLSRGPT